LVIIGPLNTSNLLLGSSVEFSRVPGDNNLGTYSSNSILLILRAGEVEVRGLDILGTEEPVKVRGRTYSIVQERDVDQAASTIWTYGSIDSE